MSFVHVSLLAGAAFAVFPFVLHFIGRREPKRITFPALRFVRETAVQSQRGWSIRRWLLLIVRMLLIVLAAFAFASPRVHSSMQATYVSVGILGVLALIATAASLLAYASRRSTRTWSSLALLAIALWIGGSVWMAMGLRQGSAVATQASAGPIAAAIVIDTSPTMDYRYANVARLDLAKETALWLMDRLPRDSQIGIITATQGQRLQPGRLAANRQLENVRLEGAAVDLPSRIRTALDLVRSSKIERREIYVLTDLSLHAWASGESSSIKELLQASARDKPVLLQIVNLGVDKPENWTLSDCKLSQDIVVPGGSVDIDVSLASTRDTPTSQLAVELHVEKRDSRLPMLRNGEVVLPESSLQEKQNVEIPAGGKAMARFTLRDLEEGTTHASIRLSRPDPLAIDNQVTFTVEAIQVGQQLVLGSLDASSENQAFTAAAMLDPKLEQVILRTYGDLAKLELERFDTILMVDPPQLSQEEVAKLDRYVQTGHGLMMILGRAHGTVTAWSESPTTKLLPGKLSLQWRRPLTDVSHYFVSEKPGHPVWNIFDRTASTIPWNRFPVFKYWVLENLTADASTILRYSSSGHPALVEQPRGAGRILTMTTTMTDPDALDDPPWNRLWATSDNLPDFGLLLGCMHYLSSSGDSQRNFIAGNPVTIENPSDVFPTRYDLFNPIGEVVRIQSQANQLTYPYAQQPGTYRLRSVQADRSALRGFSIQLDPQTTRLERVPKETLDTILGSEQYALASQRDDLQNSIGQARLGKDLAPFLLVVLLLVVIAEQAMSYRFYALGTKATNR